MGGSAWRGVNVSGKIGSFKLACLTTCFRGVQVF